VTSFYWWSIKWSRKSKTEDLDSLTNALKALVRMIHFLFIKYMNMRMRVLNKLVVFMNYFYRL